MKSETQRQALLDGLLQCRGAHIVSRDGGLIGNLTAAENIALPLHYHAIKSESQASGTVTLFYRCGLIGEHEMPVLLAKLPEQMSAYEKRLVGFMRAICIEPELIVYDGIYDGLARRELELVGKFDECFHLYFPFRTSVLLSFENFNHPTGSHPQLIYLDDVLK